MQQVEGFAGALRPAGLHRRVEPGEPDLVSRRSHAVVLADPFHQRVVRWRGPEPVAEALRHHLVEATVAAADVVIDHPPRKAVRFQHHTAAPLVVDEPPE